MNAPSHATSGRLLYAQSGGVTAVINASAAAVIETARAHGVPVYAARNGILGALREDLIDTTKETAKAIAGLRHTPGGAFGSCRYKLKSLQESYADYARLIDVSASAPSFQHGRDHDRVTCAIFLQVFIPTGAATLFEDDGEPGGGAHSVNHHAWCAHVQGLGTGSVCRLNTISSTRSRRSCVVLSTDAWPDRWPIRTDLVRTGSVDNLAKRDGVRKTHT